MKKRLLSALLSFCMLLTLLLTTVQAEGDQDKRTVPLSFTLYIEKAENQWAFGAVRNVKTIVVGDHEVLDDLEFWQACGRIYVIPVTSIELDHSSMTMPLNAYVQLTATILPLNATNQNIVWSSSNVEVSTVSTQGKVTTKAPGTCVITATTEDGGKVAICTITVEEDAWAVGENIVARLRPDESDSTGTMYVLEVTGTDVMTDFGSAAKTPWYSRRSEISKVSVEEGITNIGKFAFNSLSNLEEVNLPEGLLSIGPNAFTNCKKLQTLEIPSTVTTVGVNATYGCSGLQELIFKDSSGVLQLPAGGVFPAGRQNQQLTVTVYCDNPTIIDYPWSDENWDVTIVEVEE